MSNFLVKNGDKANWEIPEGYPWAKIVPTVFVDETITVSESSDPHKWMFSIVAGENYKIIWDGQEYEVTVQSYQNDILFLGNPKYFRTEIDSGEPFLIYYLGGADYVVVSELGNHTVSITGARRIVHPLDASYLPDLVINMTTNHYDEFLTFVTFAEIEEAVKAGKKVYIRMTYETDSKYFVICPLRYLYAGSYATFDYDETSAYEAERISLDRKMIVIRADNTIEEYSAETPAARPYMLGSVKQAAAVANVTAAPTAEEFNALLKSLRDAGILATE